VSGTLYKVNGILHLYRVQVDGSCLKGDQLGLADDMHGEVLSIQPFDGYGVGTGVHHIIYAESIEGRPFGHAGFRAEPGIQFIGRNDGLTDIAGVLVHLDFYKKVLADLFLYVLAGAQHIVLLYFAGFAAERIGHGWLKERIAEWTVAAGWGL